MDEAAYLHFQVVGHATARKTRRSARGRGWGYGRAWLSWHLYVPTYGLTYDLTYLLFEPPMDRLTLSLRYAPSSPFSIVLSDRPGLRCTAM